MVRYRRHLNRSLLASIAINLVLFASLIGLVLQLQSFNREQIAQSTSQELPEGLYYELEAAIANLLYDQQSIVLAIDYQGFQRQHLQHWQGQYRRSLRLSDELSQTLGNGTPLAEAESIKQELQRFYQQITPLLEKAIGNDFATAAEAQQVLSQYRHFSTSLELALSGLALVVLEADNRQLVNQYRQHELRSRYLWIALAAIVATALAASLWLYRRLTRAEQQMAQHGSRDVLTGFYNRRGLHLAIEQLRESDAPGGAILYLGLNDFRRFTLACGYRAGDKLLKQLANLVFKLRDDQIIARSGADEFAIYLPNLDDQALQDYATSLLERIELFRCDWQQQLYGVSASIGIARFGQGERCTRQALQQAESCYRQARNLGNNRYLFFAANSEQQKATAQQLAKLATWRQALHDRNLALFAQPQLNGQSQASAMRLTARLQVEDKNIHACQWRAVATEYGLNCQLDLWLIEQLAERLARSEGQQGLWAIRLSDEAVRSSDFASALHQLLDLHPSLAQRLSIEWPQQAANDICSAQRKLAKSLRERGCELVLLASKEGLWALGSQQQLAFQRLKVDGRWLAACWQSSEARPILDAQLSSARQLRLQLSAYHIDSEHALFAARQLGIESLQGSQVAAELPLESALKCHQSVTPHRDNALECAAGP